MMKLQWRSQTELDQDGPKIFIKAVYPHMYCKNAIWENPERILDPSLSLSLESCVQPVANSVSLFGRLPFIGPTSLQLEQLKTQLVLHQLNAIASSSITQPANASPALTLLNLLKVSMSNPLYPRGGLFSNAQRPIVPSNYGGVAAQPRMELGASRLGPSSMSGAHGGFMVNQSFSVGHISPADQNLRAARDHNLREFSSGSTGPNQPPSKLYASSSMDLPSTSSQLFKTSQLPTSQPPTRYTSESATNILASFGLSNEDLELLSLYPDDQLTPNNLPFILRDIRIRKTKRDIGERTECNKIIDYGHSSNSGHSEDGSTRYAPQHLPKEPAKFLREVPGPSFAGILKKPQITQSSQGTKFPEILQPSLIEPGLKKIPPRVSASQPSLTPSPQMQQQFFPQKDDFPATQSPSFIPFISCPSNQTPKQRLPVGTLMNDYSASTPRIFPHTCSLCNSECNQIKDWLEHQNTSLHIENCRRLRKLYPDWSVETVHSLRPEPKAEHHSSKRRARSSSSRSPSPKRHYDTKRRKRSKSHSRSNSSSPSHSKSRDYGRYQRSRSRSRSHHRVSRPRRRSRSPSQRSRSPVCSKRSPRRSSPRRSPSRQKRSSNSDDLLTKKLMLTPELSSITDHETLKAVVKTLAPALLAELAQKKSSSATSSSKGSTRSSSSKRRSPSQKNYEAVRSPPQKSQDSSSKLLNTSKGTLGKKEAEEPVKNVEDVCPVKSIFEWNSPATKPVFTQKAKPANPVNTPQKETPVVKPFEPKKAIPTPKTKPPANTTGNEPAVANKPGKKAIPWRKNIVEISKLPEEWVTEEELAVLAKPFGFIGDASSHKLRIAVSLHKAYLQMPDTKAVLAMVNAYSKTSAKVRGKVVSVKMMMQPIDLGYTESVFRVLVGMQKSPEIVTLPERLLVVSNVPKNYSSIKEVKIVVKKHGAFKKFLPLNGKILFEMVNDLTARKVFFHFLKNPCQVQGSTLSFTVAKPIKLKKKTDVKGENPPAATAPKINTPGTSAQTKVDEVIVIDDDAICVDAYDDKRPKAGTSEVSEATKEMVCDKMPNPDTVTVQFTSASKENDRDKILKADAATVQAADASKGSDGDKVPKTGTTTVQVSDTRNETEANKTTKADTASVQVTDKPKETDSKKMAKVGTDAVQDTDTKKETEADKMTKAGTTAVQVSDEPKETDSDKMAKAGTDVVQVTDTWKETEADRKAKSGTDVVQVTDELKETEADEMVKSGTDVVQVTDKPKETDNGNIPKAGTDMVQVTDIRKEIADEMVKSGTDVVQVTDKPKETDNGNIPKTGTAAVKGISDISPETIEKTNIPVNKETVLVTLDPGSVTKEPEVGSSSPMEVPAATNKDLKEVSSVPSAESTTEPMNEVLDKSLMEHSKSVVSVKSVNAELGDSCSAPASESPKTTFEVKTSAAVVDPEKTTLELSTSIAAEEPEVKSSVSILEFNDPVEATKAEQGSVCPSILASSIIETKSETDAKNVNPARTDDAPKAQKSTSTDDNHFDSKSVGSSETTAVEAMETQSPEEITRHLHKVEVCVPQEQEVNSEAKSTDMPSKTDNQNESFPNLGDYSDQPTTSNQLASGFSVKLDSQYPKHFHTDDPSLDFPPVTQEILNALELAVHECRLQSSLKQAEKDSKRKVEMEKKVPQQKMVKGQSSSKKASPARKTPQANKKLQAEKRSGSRLGTVKTSSPDTSKYSSRDHSDGESSSKKSYGMSTRRSRRQPSPPMKRSRGSEVDMRVRRRR
ncbi:hypothetical protein DNTS_024220 [Danionella cerebrum]|uniref:Matrin-type domain-containing protein n=1 Tax=Danionella cerebrum TaxID=2873325 RepID=A0A553QUQ7_9TELE|nr:hypothetical protein DNTS_024220 [Danionella translucida]